MVVSKNGFKMVSTSYWQPEEEKCRNFRNSIHILFHLLYVLFLNKLKKDDVSSFFCIDAEKNHSFNKQALNRLNQVAVLLKREVTRYSIRLSGIQFQQTSWFIHDLPKYHTTTFSQWAPMLYQLFPIGVKPWPVFADPSSANIWIHPSVLARDNT